MARKWSWRRCCGCEGDTTRGSDDRQRGSKDNNQARYGNGHCISMYVRMLVISERFSIGGMRCGEQHSCRVACKCSRNRRPFTENGEQEWLGHPPHSMPLAGNRSNYGLPDVGFRGEMRNYQSDDAGNALQKSRLAPCSQSFSQPSPIPAENRAFFWHQCNIKRSQY